MITFFLEREREESFRDETEGKKQSGARESWATHFPFPFFILAREPESERERERKKESGRIDSFIFILTKTHCSTFKYSLFLTKEGVLCPTWPWLCMYGCPLAFLDSFPLSTYLI
jgi:hypothetical protein